MNMRNTYYFQNVIFPRYNISQPKFVYFEYSMKINHPMLPPLFPPKVSYSGVGTVEHLHYFELFRSCRILCIGCSTKGVPHVQCLVTYVYLGSQS